METIVSGIDAALRTSGWAHIRRDVEGLYCVSGISENRHDAAHMAALLVMAANPLERSPIYYEAPQSYGARGRARMDGVAALREVRREYEKYLDIKRRTVFINPQQWKGQVPKDIHNERIQKEALRLFGAHRKTRLLAQSDAWDAVGIALYGLARIQQREV